MSQAKTKIKDHILHMIIVGKYSTVQKKTHKITVTSKYYLNLLWLYTSKQHSDQTENLLIYILAIFCRESVFVPIGNR